MSDPYDTEKNREWANVANHAAVHNTMRAAERLCENNPSAAPDDYARWLCMARYFRAVLYRRFPEWGAGEMRRNEWHDARLKPVDSDEHLRADEIMKRPLADYAQKVSAAADNLFSLSMPESA